ncbi:AMP-binding protein [Polaromonas hydrogenivorans]|uniref:AMP-binding protein n=1 Tax=Polaromonas hydrogenivorans TaxID=335476 RepID=A0AAU7LVZ8_9BURK
MFARFAAFARQQPDHPAVIEAGRTWSYGDLYRLALRVAACIEQDAPSPIAVLLPMGAPLAAVFLGALAVGRPYVPLDPAFPPERNRLILEQAGAGCLISDAAGQALMASTPGMPPLVDFNALDECLPSGLAGCAESIAYIIYTSGSTGQPKGVYQDQRGLLHDVYQYSHAIHLHPGDRLTWLYSPSVNGAIRDIYAALLNGATLVSINIRDVGLGGLGRRVAQCGITVFHAIPALLRAFLQSGPKPENLVSVRLAYVAGDRFFSSDVDMFYEHFPHRCLIYNGIGSTECATLYRHWFLGVDRQFDSAVVPAGYPVQERETRLLDTKGQAVARGEVGEVEVCSPFVARGYWRNPELSRQAFREDPERPAWRRFMTGDLARERADGLLEFVGRKDAQVKIRGHRVEPGAVEAELRSLPGVEDAAVVLTGTAVAPELSAWLCGNKMTQESLRELLQGRLPAASIPANFHWLERIPRLPNFKTDLAALKRLLPKTSPLEEPEHPGDALHGDDSSLEIRHSLAACWNEALQRQGFIDPIVSFADQGGDSLAAMSLLVLLEKTLARSLEVGLVHGKQTFEGLVQALMVPDMPRTRLYVVVRPGSSSFPWLAGFSASLPKSIQVQIVPLPLVYEEAVSASFIQTLGATVAAYIKKQPAAGPVHLLGLSFGARIAFDAACQLVAAGVAVGALIAGDMGPAFYQKSWPARLQKRGWQMMQIMTGRERLQLKKKAVAVLRLLSPSMLKKLSAGGQKFSGSENVPDQKNMLMDALVIHHARNWQPGYFPGTVTVLVATKELHRGGVPDDLGWGPYAGGLACIGVPCEHTELLGEATAIAVTQHILGAMKYKP